MLREMETNNFLQVTGDMFASGMMSSVWMHEEETGCCRGVS